MSSRMLPALLLPSVLVLVGSLACKPKLSEEAKAAQEAAQAADVRVKNLEQELAELRNARANAGVNAADHQQVTKSQEKALEKIISDAKRRAEKNHQKAENLAKGGSAEPAKTPAGGTAAPAPAPVVVVDVPAGTRLDVKLDKDLSTDTIQAGESWRGSLASAVMVGPRVIWPVGTEVQGVVTQSIATDRLSTGKGGLGIRLTDVGANSVEAGTYLVVGEKRGERNGRYIAGGAALGALVGILSDKDNRRDHAIAGAAAGALAGTAAAAGTAETVVRIPAANPVSFTLTAAEKVAMR